MTTTQTNRIAAIGMLGLFLAAPLPSTAVDGVIQINQDKALAGGVNFFDAAGFPISISEPGSYRLTGSLVSDSTTANAIEISASGVTLDLNGYTINGPGNLGSANGISSTQAGVRIINGTVRSFPGHGITSSASAVIERVETIGNSGHGIDVASPGSLIRGCRADSNLSDGIRTGSEGSVLDSIATGNQGDGIECLDRCTVARNTVFNNGANGIHVDDASTVTGNTTSGNTEDGIKAGNGCTISNNTVNNNGGHGVCAFSGNALIGNTVTSNTGNGLDLAGSSGYGQNVLFDNTGGTVSASAQQIGDNVCNGGTCP